MKSLAKLLQSEGSGGPREFRNLFWEPWSEENRCAVAEGIWDVAPSEIRDGFIARIASRMRFRPIYVRRAATFRRAKWLLKVTTLRDEVDLAEQIAKTFLFDGCKPLCEGFMQRLSIPNESGVPSSTDYPLPSAELVQDTIAWARDSFGESSPELLLGLIACVEPRWRSVLREALADEVQRQEAQVAERISLEPTITAELPTVAPELAAEEGAREPEDTESFTTLDNLLIKSIVASLNEIEGALNQDAVDDLVEEIVELNADRHRSFFHKGYLDALRRREFRWSFPGENESRRRWYLAGVLMALTRLNRFDELVSIYDSRRELALSLLSRPAEAGAMVAPFVFQALRQSGRLGEALNAIREPFHALRAEFAIELLTDAAELLRKGNFTEASQILEFLNAEKVGILRRLRDVDSQAVQFFEERLRRKTAQVYQFLGDLAQARQLLDELIGTGKSRELASILADRGLVEGGFKALAEVRLPEKPEEEEQLREALERGEDFFGRAMDEDQEYAMNAAYCLGVLAILQKEEKRAVTHFGFAVAGMSRQAEAYSVERILQRAQFLLGLLLLESLETGRAFHASELLQNSLRYGVDVPLRWWARAVVAASVYGDTLTRQIAEELYSTVGDKALSALATVSGTLHVPAVREALKCRSQQVTQKTAQRWEDWASLLGHYLDAGPLEEAEEALDALELISQQEPERAKFLELLEVSSRYEPAWGQDDAAWARIRLLEASGRYEQAASLLAMVFHSILVDPDEKNLHYARQILERIRSYGIRDYDHDRLERRLEALSGRIEIQLELVPDADLLATGSPVQVVFVGGDETQARHDQALLDEIQRAYPRVRIEFVHTNMSSNWGRQFDDMRGRLEAADAVVVMRMIRTQLGRAIRRVSQLWVPCVGRGKGIHEAGDCDSRHRSRQAG